MDNDLTKRTAFTLRLTPELRKQVRIAAINEGVSTQRFIEQLIESRTSPSETSDEK